MADANLDTTPLSRPLKAADGGNGEFRLIVLLPGKPESPITCNLFIASINSPPSYEALSYTWGDPFSGISETQIFLTPNSTITLNGIATSIGYNLEGALRSLRHELEPRVLWIDALCINQKNDEEKSSQVRAMSVIYKNAERVLSWLGEHDRHVDQAFETLEIIHWVAKVTFVNYCCEHYSMPFDDITAEQIIQLLLSSGGFPGSTEGCQDSFTSIHGTSTLLQPTWMTTEAVTFAHDMLFNHQNLIQSAELHTRINSIREVFSLRSYWDRLWVLQEQLMAKNLLIICGNRKLKIDDMCLIRWFIDVDGPFLSDILMNIPNFMAPRELSQSLINLVDTHDFVLRRKEDKMSLSELVQKYGYRNCLDPRDAIFSLLGVAAPIEMEVDYSSRIEDVFKNTTRKIIEQEDDLNILCNDPKLISSQMFSTGNHIAIPSWVPNFGDSFGTNFLIAEGAGYDAQYYKAGGPKIQRKFPYFSPLDEDVLVLEGFLFDSINTKNDRQCINDTERSLEALKDYWDIAKKWRPSNLGKGNSEIEFWRAILMDRYRDHSGYTSRISHSTTSRHNFENDILQAIETSLPVPKFLDCLGEVSEGKSFCITQNGSMVMVSGEVDVGDVVFVPRNCSCPFVIRPLLDTQYRLENSLSEGNEGSGNGLVGAALKYRLVGPAYVHGIMDGEFIGAMRGQKLDERVVFLV